MTDRMMKEKPQTATGRATRPKSANPTGEHGNREKARHAIAAETERKKQAEKDSKRSSLDRALEQSMDGSDPPSRLQP